MAANAPFHGSDLEKIEQLYGIPKEEITGFGSNVNPLGLSVRLKEYLAGHLDVLSSYPDRDYTALRQAIAAYTGTEAAYVLCGNGSTELISACIRTLSPRRALLVSPSYSEYERELRLAGCRPDFFPLSEEADFRLEPAQLIRSLKAEPSPDMLILCNPNNPTSGAACAKDLIPLLSFCQERGIHVMVDETYAEFAPDVDAVSAIPLAKDFSCLIVLRGISKFWAAPGLRLGYAVTSDERLRSEILSRKDPWTVSSLADLAGRFLFSDTSYIQETRALISAERSRMLQALSGLSVKSYPCFANFVLCRSLKKEVTAHLLFETAIRQGLLIRDCSDFPGLDERFFRFCFLMPEQNDRLLACLTELLG
ncbi:MAG TPA: aminotransferase class I/II-fold pyridoxal phosphate-dependent enzyme [Candidatus Eisenbergiella merdavium]|uniref:Aminotransferase n=1 Tax=Candidatus Eisenbergiella merdavium TaxID=2838551 RepID=A0A9D2NF52_9FIRM|nr:aminotransferase class I/II-fold pyridoxal phosphate-dependent enzyme [Candidatus Eisenbergiella merdavium]